MLCKVPDLVCCGGCCFKSEVWLCAFHHYNLCVCFAQLFSVWAVVTLLWTTPCLAMSRCPLSLLLFLICEKIFWEAIGRCTVQFDPICPTVTLIMLKLHQYSLFHHQFNGFVHKGRDFLSLHDIHMPATCTKLPPFPTPQFDSMQAVMYSRYCYPVVAKWTCSHKKCKSL